ncbi:Uncharacterised protein [Klebsiella michiganensis]|nr:Uncharacterised protein [Klebsiella michiganensis]
MPVFFLLLNTFDRYNQLNVLRGWPKIAFDIKVFKMDIAGCFKTCTFPTPWIIAFTDEFRIKRYRVRDTI